MDNEDMIQARDFCHSYNVEMSFLYSLSDAGLLQITTVEENLLIATEQLPELEKWVRLRYEMDINVEGIEAIHHLLEQMKNMREEMKLLKNRLGIYEHAG
jgi:hypothetical protein